MIEFIRAHPWVGFLVYLAGCQLMFWLGYLQGRAVGRRQGRALGRREHVDIYGSGFYRSGQ